MTNLTSAIPQLAALPPCAIPAFGAIAATGCGPDLACICGNDDFYLTLEGILFAGTCSPIEGFEAYEATQSICSKAVPWLNDNRGPEIVAAITILSVLSTVAFALRILARKVSSLNFGTDDWLIAVALLWAYGLTISQYIAVHYGFGRHMLMLEPAEVIPFTKCYFAATMLFVVSAAAIKLSILFFYHRIFPTRVFRNVSIAIGVAVIAWFVLYVFLIFFACIPLEYFWDKTLPGGHCVNIDDTSYYGTSPPDIVTNIAILILPVPYLWKLQMHRAKKVAIMAIFVLGSFATLGSVVRIPLIHELKTTDVSWSIVNPGIWLNVECNIGILSACLPTLRPLFTKTFGSTIRSRLPRSRNSRYGLGSQRLPDVEKNTQTSTLSSNVAKSGLYEGGNKGHRSWYNNAVSTIASKNDDVGSDGSQEEMVPMGRIAVRHDMDWDAKDREGPVTPHAV